MDGSSSDVLEFDSEGEAGVCDLDATSDEELHIDSDDMPAVVEDQSDSCSLVASDQDNTAALALASSGEDEDLLLVTSSGLEMELEDDGDLLEEMDLLEDMDSHRGGLSPDRGGLSPGHRPFRWAHLLLRALLCSMTMPVLLESFLLSSFTLSTNFSGIGTAEHAGLFLEAASLSAFGHKVSMRCTSACDHNPRNQAILESMGTGACVYGDILSASQLGDELFQAAAGAG